MIKLSKIPVAVIIGSFIFWNLNNVKADTNSHVLQSVGRGEIDWTANTITVTGSGALPEGKSGAQARLMAERAAVADGYRQLAEVVNGVRIDSETIVENFVTQSDVIKTNVSGLIKGARILEKKISQDGAAECVMSVSIYGVSGLADAVDLDQHIINKGKNRSGSLLKNYHRMYSLLPGTDSNFSYGTSPDKPKVDMNNCLLCHKTHTEEKAIPENMQQPPENNDVNIQPTEVKNEPSKPVSPVFKTGSGKNVTGVIIDARGMGLMPAMDPAVFDSERKQIYIGSWDIDPDYVINYGVIGYYKNIEDAEKDPRVGTNPVIISAESLKGSTDLVLGPEISNTVKNLDSVNKFLKKYAVNVVM